MPLNTQELWNRADALLDGLLDLTPEQRREALAKMSLDDDLRTAVGKLLAAHESGGVLDRSGFGSFGGADPGALSDRQLGRWRLEHEIGRGGMAVVYRAQAIDGSAQSAAVKVLTLGALASRGNALFRQEQAVLARMRHPHIASLFESGIADDGTPWLAMALVEGVRIDVWCAQNRLSPGAIVALIIDVCEAVAYAHRNLVIHRDLKPSNVMVDQDGHVRLLDFGIARLADQGEGNTVTEWRALTPDYAAPEQFSGASPSTAMDVFGLGALLYRLLTGRPPSAGSLDFEEKILAPSKAMQNRRASAASKGDLDAIVMKAMARDPAQRYETVPAFADDLRRWHRGLPVLAQRPTLLYRFGRFARRHSGSVTAAAIAILAIVAGLMIAIWQARKAERAADEAIAQAARSVAEQERAERQLKRADALRDFLTRLFAATDPGHPSERVSDVAQLLEVGTQIAQERGAAEPAVQADILTTIGGIYSVREGGSHPRARAVLDEAIARARSAGPDGAIELARALIWRGALPTQAKSPHHDEALFLEAADLLLTHAPKSSLRIDLVLHLSWAKLGNDHPDEVLTLIEPVVRSTWSGPTPTSDQYLTLLDRLGIAYTRLERPHDAKKVYDEILAIEKRNKADGTRGFAIVLVNAANAERRLGYFAEASAKIDDALSIYEAFGSEPTPTRAGAYARRGQLLAAQGRFDAARDAVDASFRERAAWSKVPFAQYPYAYGARGRLAASAMRFAEAERELQRFIELVPEHSRDSSGDRALILGELAGAQCALGNSNAGAATLVAAHRDAALGAYDRAYTDRTIVEAAARCALARGDIESAIKYSDQRAALDARLFAGDAGEISRHALLRIDIMLLANRKEEAKRAAREALARLHIAGLNDHPFFDRLLAAGK